VDGLAQFGRIDVLVNNAAAPHGADRNLLWEIPEVAWGQVIDINLYGRLTHLFLTDCIVFRLHTLGTRLV